MTCDIISFPRNLIVFEADERRERVAARNRFVERIRTAAAAGEKFSPRDDRIWPAQAIDRLFRDERLRPREVGRILAEKAEGTVHLERLRQDCQLPPEKARSRQKGLSTSVKPYVQVLDAIADLGRQQPDDLIADAFRNTSFGEAAFRGADGASLQMTFLLKQMCDAVIRAEDLPAYFRKARETHGSYDPATGEIERSDQPVIGPPYLNPEFQNAGYEGASELSWIQRPFPAVPLARIRRAVFSGPLLVEKKVLAPSGCSAEDVGRMLAGYDEGRALGAHGPVAAEVRYHTDVRLAIGPTWSLDRIGPLFEIRTHVDLLIDGAERALTFPHALFRLGERNESDGFLTSVAAHFDDGWRCIGGFGADAWTGDEDLDAAFGLGWDVGPHLQTLIGEEGGRHEFPVFWETVNWETTGQLMRLFSRSDCKAFIFEGREPPPKQLLFPGCQELELSMRTGGLEAFLQERCRELKSALDAHLRRLEITADEEIEAMLRRWRDMGRTSSPDHETHSKEDRS